MEENERGIKEAMKVGIKKYFKKMEQERERGGHCCSCEGEEEAEMNGRKLDKK
jgi:hypothetical protein